MRTISLLAAVIAIATIICCFTTAGFTSAVVEELDEQATRCKICERSIGYVWHQGVELRSHCKSEERSDPRCDLSNIHDYGIEEMVRQVCDKLPKTHQAIHESEFDLIAHDDPKHPEHIARKMREICIKWVHHEHGLDTVALYLFANLDAGKQTEQILHMLQHKFCRNACNPDYKQQRIVQEYPDPDAKHSTYKDQTTTDL